MFEYIYIYMLMSTPREFGNAHHYDKLHGRKLMLSCLNTYVNSHCMNKQMPIAEIIWEKTDVELFEYACKCPLHE